MSAKIPQHCPPADKLRTLSFTPTDSAKDCVRRLLDRDPTTRASAAEILQHPWLAENGVASSDPINLEVLTRLQKFAASDRLQREAMRVSEVLVGRLTVSFISPLVSLQVT